MHAVADGSGVFAFSALGGQPRPCASGAPPQPRREGQGGRGGAPPAKVIYPQRPSAGTTPARRGPGQGRRGTSGCRDFHRSSPNTTREVLQDLCPSCNVCSRESPSKRRSPTPPRRLGTSQAGTGTALLRAYVVDAVRSPRRASVSFFVRPVNRPRSCARPWTGTRASPEGSHGVFVELRRHREGALEWLDVPVADAITHVTMFMSAPGGGASARQRRASSAVRGNNGRVPDLALAIRKRLQNAKRRDWRLHSRLPRLLLL